MKTKLVVLVAAILCVALVFASCATTPPAASSAAAPASSAAAPASSAAAPASSAAASAVASEDYSKAMNKNIGYILSGPDIYYQQSFAVFEGLSKALNWNITKVSSNYDPKTETNNTQDMIAKKVDAIVLNDVTESNGAACAKLANDAKIPIFFITTLPDPNGVGKPDGSCSGPWYQNGVDAATWLLPKAKDPKNPKFVLIEGAYGQGTIELQRLGFLTYLSQQLNKTVQEVFDDNIVYNQTGGWMTDTANTVMQDALAKTGGDFDGIFVGNEAMTLGVQKAIQPTGKDYPIATENGYEETWAAMKANPKLDEMVDSIPSTAEGELVFQQIRAYFSGLPYPKFVKCPIVSITPANVATANPLPYKDTAAYLALSAQGKTVNINTTPDSGAENPDWSSMIPLNGAHSK